MDPEKYYIAWRKAAGSWRVLWTWLMPNLCQLYQCASTVTYSSITLVFLKDMQAMLGWNINPCPPGMQYTCGGGAADSWGKGMTERKGAISTNPATALVDM